MKKTTLWVFGLFLLSWGGGKVAASLPEENEFTPLLRQSEAASRDQVTRYFEALRLPEGVYPYGYRGLHIMTSVEFSPPRHSIGVINRRWYLLFMGLRDANTEKEKIALLNKAFQFHFESIKKIDPLFLKTMKEMECKYP